jgi:hypothetical protein
VYALGQEVKMKAIAVTELSAQQLTVLADLYRTTRDVRLRTRAQMVLLAAEQHLTRPPPSP